MPSDLFASFTVHGATADTYEFHTEQDYSQFLQREVSEWKLWLERVAPSLETSRPASLSAQNLVSQWQQTWDEYAAASDDSQKQKAINEFRSRLVEQRRLLTSQSRIGALVIGLALKEPRTSGFVAYLALPRAGVDYFRELQNESVREFWNRFAAALPGMLGDATTGGFTDISQRNSEAIAQHHSDAAGELAKLKEIVAASDAKLAARLDALTSEIQAITASFSEATEKSLAEARDEWARLRRTYDLKLKIQAPFTYWRAKERLHKRSAKGWMKGMLYSAALGGSTLLFCLYHFGDSKSAGAWPWLPVAAAVGLPAFATLWAVRLCNRLYSEQLMRAEDAKERAVMVRTLRAISKSEFSDKIFEQSQAEVIAKALFRTGPGLSSDDAPSVSALESAINLVRGKA